MPLTKKKKYVNKLSNDSKSHYDKVVKIRKIKGCISIVSGVIMSIICHLLLKNESDKLQKKSLVIFVGVGTIYIIDEILWQDKFIFEEKDIDRMSSDKQIYYLEMEDIRNYSLIYKKSRYISNIIELLSLLVSIIITFILIIYKKI